MAIIAILVAFAPAKAVCAPYEDCVKYDLTY